MSPRVLALVVGACALLGCEREERRFQELAPSTELVETRPARVHEAPYDDNAWAVAQGARYFVWFNCVGCHAAGGGGMGPPLMDEEWRYGSSADDIFTSIVEGRPNGMPAFGGRIPAQQVWMLVSYVRSLSGLVPLDSAPGRRDDVSPHAPPAMLDHFSITKTRRETPEGVSP